MNKRVELAEVVADIFELLQSRTLGQAGVVLLVALAKIIALSTKDNTPETFSAIEHDLEVVFNKYAPLDRH